MKLKLRDGTWDVALVLGRSEPGQADPVTLQIGEETSASRKLLCSGQLTLTMSVPEAQELARGLLALTASDAAGIATPTPAPNRPISPAPPQPAENSPAPFTATQGRYLEFIHRYQAKFGRAPAEADIQRHMLVAAPSVNQMMRTLERKGLITRTPGQARSIRILVPPGMIPPP